MLKIKGKMSIFGGPYDGPAAGNEWPAGYENEGLALIDEEHLSEPHIKSLFLDKSKQDPRLPGLARKLNPARFYVAARWDYRLTPKSWLRANMVTLYAPSTGKRINAWPVDQGPATWTGRVVDMSPGAAKALGLKTDDIVEMLVPTPQDPKAESDYKPVDPRDQYQGVGRPSSKGGSMLIGLLRPLLMPLIISVVTSMLKSWLQKEFGGIFSAVLKSEQPGKKGPEKEEEAMEILYPKASRTEESPDLKEELLRALIQGAVGLINDQKGKDWSDLLGEFQTDGKSLLKRLLE